MGYPAQLAKKYDETQAQTKHFRTLSNGSWDDGAISSVNKHLIAVAVAHATTCHRCLTHHAKVAKKEGATVDQLLEISYLTSVVNILGDDIPTLLHDNTVDSHVDQVQDQSIHQKISTYLHDQLKPVSVEKEIKLLALIAIVRFKENHAVLKQLIAYATAQGVNQHAIDEAILVSVVLSAGIIYSHNLELIALYESPELVA